MGRVLLFSLLFGAMKVDVVIQLMYRLESPLKVLSY